MITAEQHQYKIAKSTLKMSPVTARIMGGMTYEEAYQFVFKTDLKARLNQLVVEYPTCDTEWFCWELSRYGHTPGNLIKQL